LTGDRPVEQFLMTLPHEGKHWPDTLTLRTKRSNSASTNDERRTEFSVAPDEAVREDAIVEMRGLVWDVRKLQANLGWLDAAQQPPLDLGRTYFVEAGPASPRRAWRSPARQ